jgi:hypothetical protein
MMKLLFASVRRHLRHLSSISDDDDGSWLLGELVAVVSFMEMSGSVISGSEVVSWPFASRCAAV